MTDPLTRQRLSRAKRKAAGLCRSCTLPVCKASKNYCEDHDAANRDKLDALRRRKGHADRVPTFEQYERLCERGEG
jgi:hypothetical protein